MVSESETEFIARLNRTIAFAVLKQYHVFDEDPEITYFICPRCRAEFSFDKWTLEEKCIAVLIMHTANHLDKDYVD